MENEIEERFDKLLLSLGYRKAIEQDEPGRCYIKDYKVAGIEYGFAVLTFQRITYEIIKDTKFHICIDDSSDDSNIIAAVKDFKKDMKALEEECLESNLHDTREESSK